MGAQALVADELDRLVDLSIDMLGIATMSGRILAVNPAWSLTLGWSENELRGRKALEFVHPDDRERTLRQSAELATPGNEIHDLEIRLLHRDGSTRWLLWGVRSDGDRLYAVAHDITRRKHVEAAAREAVELFRVAFEDAPIGMAIWRLEREHGFRPIEVNRAMSEMMRRPAEELLATPPGELVYGDDFDIGRDDVLALLGGEVPSCSIEKRLVRGDGSLIWAQLRLSIAKDAAGAPRFGICQLQDVTAAHEAADAARRREHALRASEERYRNIVETTSEGVWMIDADHRTTYVNRRMAEMLGYTVEEMLGRPVADFTAPDRRALLEGSLERRRRGVADQREMAYQRKDGSTMWALLSGSPLTDGKGGYGGALAMISDITERKRADEEIARLASIVESAPDAILSTDLDGRITSWNAAAERLLGWSAREALGMQVWDLASRDAKRAAAKIDGRLLAGGAIASFRTDARRRDGSFVQVEPSLSAIAGPGGEPVGALAIVRAVRD
jgi:PAS domain S-box-containing protein